MRELCKLLFDVQNEHSDLHGDLEQIFKREQKTYQDWAMKMKNKEDADGKTSDVGEI